MVTSQTLDPSTGPQLQRPAPITGPAPAAHGGSLALKLSKEAEDALSDLYFNLVGMLPEQSCRVVQFVASRRREGSSLLVRQLALTLAGKLGESVVLIDALARDPAQLKYFREQSTPPPEAADGPAGHDGLAQPLAHIPLHVCRHPLGVDSIRAAADAERTDAMLQAMRARFQCILIDMPAAATRLAQIQVSRQVDGVVLVIEAGRTRWQIASRMIETISSQGGRVLGVLINKVQHPIPRFLYERL